MNMKFYLLLLLFSVVTFISAKRTQLCMQLIADDDPWPCMGAQSLTSLTAALSCKPNFMALRLPCCSLKQIGQTVVKLCRVICMSYTILYHGRRGPRSPSSSPPVDPPVETRRPRPAWGKQWAKPLVYCVYIYICHKSYMCFVLPSHILYCIFHARPLQKVCE